MARLWTLRRTRGLSDGFASILLLSALVTACGGGATATATAPASTVGAASAAPTAAATRALGAATAVPATGAAAASGIKIAGPSPDEAKALTGAGATFPAVLYTKWFNEYDKVTGVKVNYQAIGSGGGIKAIQDGTVDFGASDGPMTDDQLKAAKGPVLHIPMTLGATVVTYNLPEVTDQLKFTGDTLAGIYLGQITKWNDPKLTADNPSLAKVDKNIVVVHRSDGSGTTYNWTDYLSKVSPDWKSQVGNATSVSWPVGLGGQGSQGVTGVVKQNPYAIGYVELVYALENKLPVGLVKNAAGKWIAPTVESTTAAAAGVGDSIAADLRVSIVNAPGDTAYPIATFTWQLIYQNQTDKAKAIAATRLMWWETHEGQAFSSDLHYAPLPDAIVAKDEAKIKSITVDGKAALPAQ